MGEYEDVVAGIDEFLGCCAYGGDVIVKRGLWGPFVATAGETGTANGELGVGKVVD
jgi:hypothetical protein